MASASPYVIVSDDKRVAGIGLALAAIAAGGSVDHAAEDVKHVLTMVYEHGDQQGRAAVGQVDGLGDLEPRCTKHGALLR